jgi:hypothetical protein
MTARVALGAGAVLAGLAGVAAAQACGETLGKGVMRGESTSYVVAWRADPAPIAVSRHFALDIAVCPKAGAVQPRALAVDATMPAHRHGMNYRPTVTATGAGRFRAEGLMLHMPGAWEFAFDVTGGAGTERVRVAYELK